jgi:hypothetical protein
VGSVEKYLLIKKSKIKKSKPKEKPKSQLLNFIFYKLYHLMGFGRLGFLGSIWTVLTCFAKLSHIEKHYAFPKFGKYLDLKTSIINW